MFAADLFTLDSIFERLSHEPMVRVGGFSGSALPLFIATCTRHAKDILYISEPSLLDRLYQELHNLHDDVLLIDDVSPYYKKHSIAITTREFLHQDVVVKHRVRLQPGICMDLDEMQKRLALSGYTREDIAQEAYEYALRGGILDVIAEDAPAVRMELSGDEIVSIRQFDTNSQRSVSNLNLVALELAADEPACPLNKVLPSNTLVVSHEPVDLPLRTIRIAPGGIDFHLIPSPKYYGDFSRLKKDREKHSGRMVVCTGSPQQAEKILSLLGPVETVVLPISEGFTDSVHRVTFLSEQDIFGHIPKKKRRYRGPFVDDLLALRAGDYVVHTDYGIGLYRGLKTIEVDTTTFECLQIDYAGTDKVYVPIEKLNLVERYVATTDSPPKLSRLGSDVWQKAKRRIKKATERHAIDLLNLYSRRARQPGFTFSRDGLEMQELEASFPYQETEDQAAAIEAAKNDMESDRPTERLICGDVGYGKTEIALRAAFKAALDGKQTLLLCPTTLLALQHYTTFRQRLRPFPVNVEMVSRLRTKKELAPILKKIARGSIDIIVGTHRLLQPDVKCRDLGLFIIDEEQRFGVMQKEKIKNMIPGIDTLYLSATPIPRTLYMALTGLKDISNIYTPPPGRKDIITKIMYYDEDDARQIITHEIERGGQVFFIHNRIQTIETVKTRLLKLLPTLKICVLHGRMREDITAKKMMAFLDGAYDVLLSTAIVESGLDMPRVNTIIVDNAHTFGLADLHQLRGRVGRSDIQAYSYFIVPHKLRLGGEANKRLGALASYTSLGSGFRLAVRDMEIRGVGNLLGKEQSGHINAIGYHLYLKMLSTTIDELRGARTTYEPILELKLEAYFPDTYIPSAYERTALYKRLLCADSEFELASIKEEIIDRFGKYPAEVQNLFRMSETRLKALKLGATHVKRQDKDFIYYRDGRVINRSH